MSFRHHSLVQTHSVSSAMFVVLIVVFGLVGCDEEPTALPNTRTESLDLSASSSQRKDHGSAGQTETPEPDDSKTKIAQVRKFVRDWTIKDIRRDLHRIGEGRSFADGKKLFKIATCQQCHAMSQVGGTLGPDLTGVAGRNSRVAILRELIEPSKQIPEKYQSTMIVTIDGKTHQGLVVGQDATSIRLANNPLKPEQMMSIPMSDVQEHAKSTVSMMPKGLLNTLSLNEILDLLAYIESGGQEDHPVYDYSE